MERMISLIGKLDRKVDWVEMYMERMIGSLGKLGRKVDIGRKMNDPDGALDPWSCSINHDIMEGRMGLGRGG